MRETKLLTNIREFEDLDELNRRRELVSSKSPTQLAEINGLSDIPVPSRIEKIFKKSSQGDVRSATPRSRSESLPR